VHKREVRAVNEKTWSLTKKKWTAECFSFLKKNTSEVRAEVLTKEEISCSE